MCRCFTLMTYNVHEAVGRDKLKDYYRIARVIREIEPDIIALQEIDTDPAEERTTAPAGESFMYETIGNALEYYGVKGVTMLRARSAYGNAVFYKKRPEKIFRHDISHDRREPRGVLECMIRIKKQQIRILNTHLGLRKVERVHQINALMQLIDSEEPVPVLLVGDFNEWNPFSRRLRQLRIKMKAVPFRRTFPARLPLIGLDRIFYRGDIRLMDHRVADTGLSRVASDHRPLIATFALG